MQPTPSIDRQMLNTAARAVRLFDCEAVDSVAQFVFARQNPDGGFRGRSAESDLYYTLFSIECLQALQCEHPTHDIKIYLTKKAEDDNLDFVHTACLIRSMARLSMLEENPDWKTKLLNGLNRCKTDQGLFHMETKQPSVYGNFLGMVAYEACGVPFEHSERLVALIESLKTPDGAFADDTGLDFGVTPVTAAAVILLAHLQADVPRSALDWLIARKNFEGGLTAASQAPRADLLSTATALFAMQIAGCARSVIDDSLQQFIESVWTDSGGFSAGLFDSEPDVEYTFYGLLAAGVLAEMADG